MMEKKERGLRFHVSAKDRTFPLVLLAKDDADAAAKWAKRTGRKADEAAVTAVGTQAEAIRDRMIRKAPPAVGGADAPQPSAKKVRETKG